MFESAMPCIRHGYRACIGTMEKKMESTVVCWGHIGIMENKMEINYPKP